MPDISIAASISPTEDPERISKAILNIFPGSQVSQADGKINATCTSLEQFEEKLVRQKIRDTARGFLWKAIQSNTIRFQLSKQAAFMGKVNFSEGNSVLGDLEVTIEVQDPQELVQQLTMIEEAL